jgi:ATP-dependent DNA helicase RecQ
MFFRKQNFWKGILNPLVAKSSKFETLRIAAATHRWGIDTKGFGFANPTQQQLGIIDVAQSILERGIWTLPTWRIEQYLAEKVQQDLGWQLREDDPSSTGLSYSIRSARPDPCFQNGLVAGRWPCEVNADTNTVADEIWNNFEGDQPGSDWERRFLKDVLIPVLGFPLLDYLRLQPELTTLGLDPVQFLGQRADFSLDTGRDDLKLIVEVDGSQHEEPAQKLLDDQRDKASEEKGWATWRVPTNRLDDTEELKRQLVKILGTKWGVESRIQNPRSPELLTCIWGATVVSRIQFLLLEALRSGLLPWDEPWQIAVVEADTKIGEQALEDFQDWFGRLRKIFGESEAPEIIATGTYPEGNPNLVIDISVTQPHKAKLDVDIPLAWSRPANFAGPIPTRRFATRITAATQPTEPIVTSFVRDLLRKPDLREGQLEIISRILIGEDVVGLLPTGGGKSLTYQLCGLLLGGLTIYVSPLKSLLQDQRERLLVLGVDLVQEISSAQTTAGKQLASLLLATGGIRFLLIAPERFLVPSFLNQLAQFKGTSGEVSQVVIDECHCVSEWGHDFRPAYLSLGRIAKEKTKLFGKSAPLVALTGTASSIVLSDVRRELGILKDSAVVRAKRLDRPEITMHCQELANGQKELQLQKIIQNFLGTSPTKTDGLLVFSRFINGLDGVTGITASVKANAPQNSFRFYTGSEPNWKTFAAFVLKKPAGTITDQDVTKTKPAWAQSSQNTSLDWDEIKAKVQSDFISGLPGNYQILIATNAFGMGIDKPSIRTVVHYMTPQSPEAYYQEIGRAGRDGKASTAILLFSDPLQDQDVTNRILDPGASIDQARTIYDNFIATNPFGGGDFIRTFYFHTGTFSGPEQEIGVISQLLNELRKLIEKRKSPIFNYIPNSAKATPQNVWRHETPMEYGIVRLIILGVVYEYTKDYNSKQFSLVLEPDWENVRNNLKELANYYADRYNAYIRRYLVSPKADVTQPILSQTTIPDIEKATAETLVGFVYEQVERKRRQASRQMLELARVGAKDPVRFREMLIHYLQVSEKFTKDLEDLAQHGSRTWDDLLESVESRDDLAELHGACQRVLESYPTHPGLLAISATTRLGPSKDDLKRSEEELKAALKYTIEESGVDDAKKLGDTVASYVAGVDDALADELHSVFGIWLLENDRKDEAMRFFGRKAVRDAWMSKTLHGVNKLFSDTGGL